MATEQIPKGEEDPRGGMGRMAAEWHRVGLERPTFAQGSVPKVNRGSLQPNKKILSVRAAGCEAGEEGRNYVLQLRLHHLLQLGMCISLGKTRK